MGARQKLNHAYVNGAMFWGAMIGLMAQSWVIFFIVTAITLLFGLHSGGIRPTGRRRDR